MRFSMLSKEGSRSHNEDNIGMYQDQDSSCFVLADGLGGHGKGELASETAVKAAVEILAGTDGEEELSSLIERSFLTAQEEIIRIQEADRTASDMKTTMVLLEMEGNRAVWGHIGDSRLYYFRKNRLIGRTLDHSVPQLLVRTGEIKEKQIRHHPDRNRLLRVLGASEERPRFETGDEVQTVPGDAFLLCSDGFWELIEEKKMISCMKKSGGPEEWLERMEQIVLKNGAGLEMDNYSAIAVWI